MRVTCLAVVDLALQAHRRAEPELARAPVAVADGRGLTARVIALSDEARALGVRLGMTAAQASAIAPSAAVRPADPAREAAARAALADVAAGVGPRVEPDGDLVYVEVGDLGRLFPTERAVAEALAAGARAVGLTARVGVASSKGVARLAARGGSPAIAIVPRGREAAFVAPLPVDALSPSEEARAALGRWGVASCGRLAALPAAEVALRLGREGAALAALAAGRCDAPLRPRAPADEIEEGLELDYAIAELEPLAFLLRGVADRLLARLAARHLACAGVGLRLHLDGGGHDVRAVGLAAPTRDPVTLVEIVRLAIAKRPPPAPVIGLALAGRAARAEVSQLDLFRPSGPAPDRLAATVARLQALVGEGAVGRVVPVETFRDEAIAVADYHARKSGDASGDGNDGRLVLRRFRPAKEVEVLLDGGCVPRAITGIGSVLVASGPFRTNGEWWADTGYARDAWDLHAADGALYRVYRDERDRWFVEGYYD